ncbi:abscisic stress-ripening protein 5-like [Mercurialis annua]|uniref:abscisic stress-ripening protein 5-like n=1 Tax=Mercurialis annua TaxID=3986 RepID=UPI002160E362|nr:abscisic stress-ripening protein 5-like [Mercurialis annua]
MAEQKHHHLFHRNKDEDKPDEAKVYSETTDYTEYRSEDVVAPPPPADEHDYKEEEKHHKRQQHLGELGTAAAGAFALYEKHEAKKDPEHAHRHKVEEEVAAAAAVGSGGFAFHERHDKKEAHGNKKHHLF